ncbi:MAG: prolyl oligopeptidase family serine peptidase, partial [Flavobacterium sp.]
MKKTITITAIVCTLFMNAQTKITYPETKKIDHVDTYFGEKINDPYRWLEDDRSAETEAWVKAQNVVTYDYLAQIPYRNQLKTRMEQLWNYEKISAPFKEGDYAYYYKNNGLQNQSVLYRKDKNGKEELFLDPNTFSKDGTTSLGGINFSKDGSLVAYSISEGGSDWRKVIVMEAKTKKIIGDTIVDVKFSGVSWYKNEGFYYSSYDKPVGSELSAKTDQHKLYYHKLNTPQKNDQLIFGGDVKRRYVGGGVSEDENYLFITAANSTTGNELYYLDLSKPNSKIVTLIDNYENDNDVLDNKGSKIYLVTNYKAPNKRVVTFDLSNPAKENWKDCIAETENVLSPNTGGGSIFASYMKDAVSFIKQYDYNGKLIRNIELPGIGTAGGFGGKEKETTLYFSFTNYVTPGTTYTFDVTSGKSAVYQKPKVDFNGANFESKQVFYTSKDGTKIPMIITYKKGTVL